MLKKCYFKYEVCDVNNVLSSKLLVCQSAVECHTYMLQLR
jgi:hypothetical protein